MNETVAAYVNRVPRSHRRVMLVAALNGLALGANLAERSVFAIIPALMIIVLLVTLAAQTRLLGILRERERELSRPRMTPEDYRRLAEMEVELGWEPTEMPADVKAPVAAPPQRDSGECRRCGDDVSSAQVRVPGSADPARSYCLECRRRWHEDRMRAAILTPKPDLGDLSGDLDRDRRDLAELNRITSMGTSTSAGAALSGSGSLSAAPMTGPGGRWHPVSELFEHGAIVAEHDASLDGEGRESCIAPDYCPICTERHFAALARLHLVSCIGCTICAGRDAGAETMETMRQWLEDERREQQWLEEGRWQQ